VSLGAERDFRNITAKIEESIYPFEKRKYSKTAISFSSV
jgi:hypothetical protein